MTQNTIILKQRRDTKDLKNFQYYKPVVSFLEILYKRHHESQYSSLPANITGTNSLWILNRSHLHTNPNKGENEEEHQSMASVVHETAFDSVQIAAVFETIRKRGL